MTVALQTENWEDINWKHIQKHVHRLQKRIYRASQEKKWKNGPQLATLTVPLMVSKVYSPPGK